MAFNSVSFCVPHMFCVWLVSLPLFFSESSLCLEILSITVAWQLSPLLNQSQQRITTPCTNIPHHLGTGTEAAATEEGCLQACSSWDPHSIWCWFICLLWLVFHFVILRHFIYLWDYTIITFLRSHFCLQALPYPCLIMVSHRNLDHQLRAGTLHNGCVFPHQLLVTSFIS